MICYEESIRNGTKNLDIQKDCYPACKSIMYFLEEKSRNLMESLSFNIDVYGKEYADFLENMLIPEPGMYNRSILKLLDRHQQSKSKSRAWIRKV